jgi:hypothetical protein
MARIVDPIFARVSSHSLSGDESTTMPADARAA